MDDGCDLGSYDLCGKVNNNTVVLKPGRQSDPGRDHYRFPFSCFIPGLLQIICPMTDYITIGSMIGLVIFGVLWKYASDKVWYYDADNDPVSLRTVVAYIWLVCLVVLLMKLAKM